MEADDDATDPPAQLSERIEELKKANQAAAEQLAESQKREREAQALARKHQTEVGTERDRVIATEHEYLSSALTSAQNELAAAKIMAKQAGTDADWGAQAEAHDAIADARNRINQLQNALAGLNQQIEENKEARKAPPPQQNGPTNVNDAIDQNTNLLPREREYLKAHPELVMDKGLNDELSVAHNRAMRQGVRRGSDGYFSFLDEFLGYKTPAKASERDEEMPQDNGNANVSAPVSRETSSLSTGRSTTRVTLNPEQREMAKSMGLTDAEYAAQVVRLQQAKRDDPDKYGRTR